MNELRKKIEKIVADMRAMLDLAEKEERGLTAEEEEKYNGLKDQRNSLNKLVTEMEEQEEEEKRLRTPAKTPIINDPDPTEQKGFRSLGEFLGAVIKADMPSSSRVIDPRLAEIRVATGMGESVPSDGGYLVQTDFSTELLKVAYDTGLLASRVFKLPVSANSNGLKINGVAESSRVTGSRYGGVQIYPVAEADTVTAKKPKFKQIELKLNKIMGLCYLTDELVEDTTALESFVTKAFAEEFGFMMDYYIMNGSGVGQPLGIMNSGCLITVTRNTANDIVFADIMGMWKQFPVQSRGKAVWLVNQVSEVELYGLTLTDYVPLYMPAGGLSGNMYGTLMGKPVLPIEQTSDDVGTTGDIMLADLSQYIMIDKGALKTASSLHVNFLYDEQVLRFTYRVDGQPWWSSAITSFGGNNTVSPFVVLSTKNS